MSLSVSLFVVEMNVDFLFQDKPWVYAHLLEIQRRVGKENFPLIEQAFYPSHSDMVSQPELSGLKSQ